MLKRDAEDIAGRIAGRLGLMGITPDGVLQMLGELVAAAARSGKPLDPKVVDAMAGIPPPKFRPGDEVEVLESHLSGVVSEAEFWEWRAPQPGWKYVIQHQGRRLYYIEHELALL